MIQRCEGPPSNTSPPSVTNTQMSYPTRVILLPVRTCILYWVMVINVLMLSINALSLSYTSGIARSLVPLPFDDFILLPHLEVMEEVAMPIAIVSIINAREDREASLTHLCPSGRTAQSPLGTCRTSLHRLRPA